MLMEQVGEEWRTLTTRLDEAGHLVSDLLGAVGLVLTVWCYYFFRDPPRVTPAWVLDLHRFLGGLATVFVCVHVAAVVFDSYVAFGLADVLVPLASSWHPVAVAWGVVALYLLLADGPEENP